MQLLATGAFAQVDAQATPNKEKELFFAGLKQKLDQNWPQAESSFAKLITLNPNSHAAYYELANIALRQNKQAVAQLNIDRAVELAPHNVWYLKTQAEIAKRGGNLDSWVSALDKILVLEPENQQAYTEKANALSIAGKTAEAEKVRAILTNKFGVRFSNDMPRTDYGTKKANQTNINQLLSQSGSLLEAGKLGEALQLLKQAQKDAPNNFEVHLATADVLRAQGKNDEVVAELKEAFANNDMPLPAKMQLVASMMGKKGALGNAVEIAKQMVKNHPDDAKVHLLYGDALYKQGKFNEAMASYQNAIDLADDFYAGYEKLLALQTLSGNYSKAISTADKALAIFPNQAILYYYRAFALHRNNQNAQAGLEIQNALALDSDDKGLLAMIYALQAEVFIDQQKLKDADAAFEKAIALAPSNYLVMANYAYYLGLREHNLQFALQLAEKASAGLPNNHSIIDTHSLVLMKLARYAEAKQQQQRILQNNDDPLAVYLEHYGDILYLLGEKEDAVKYWIKSDQKGNTSEKLTKKINEKKYLK